MEHFLTTVAIWGMRRNGLSSCMLCKPHVGYLFVFKRCTQPGILLIYLMNGIHDNVIHMDISLPIIFVIFLYAVVRVGYCLERCLNRYVFQSKAE